MMRYEDGFTSSRETLDVIAKKLNLPLFAADREAIHEAHTFESVKASIAELVEQGVVSEDSVLRRFDRQTLWSARHVGDGRIGKWRDILTPAQAAIVDYSTRAFRETFGYAAAPLPPPLASGAELQFSADGVGQAYLGEGFDLAESWGTWSMDNLASLKLPLARPVAQSLNLAVACILSPSLCNEKCSSAVKLTVNGRIVAEIKSGARRSPEIMIICRLEGAEVAQKDDLHLRFDFTDLLSPRELGVGADGRRLGIGLVSLQLDFEPEGGMGER
jgi:hypothetical protein